jgi:hypothetical protein
MELVVAGCASDDSYAGPLWGGTEAIDGSVGQALAKLLEATGRL